MEAAHCPPMERLEALLEDRLALPDQRHVSAHVAACPACQATLERLTEDAGRKAPAPTGPNEPADLRFLERLKRMDSSGALPAHDSGAKEMDEGIKTKIDSIIREDGATPLRVDAARFPSVPSLRDYEILGVLGRGGEGVVYKARHRPLGRVVALKMLRDGDAASPESLLRLRLEAETLAHLRHTHIVQVYEVGGDGNGRPFFAMEYVEGGSLAARLQGQPLPAREAARLVEATAEALHVAHQAGVLHRDLKPANILLAPGPGLGTPKVTDFGLAKRVQVEMSLTRTGAVLGTPGYMAPEQAQGKEVSPACDVYALGSILYHLLTGRPPFVGARPMEILLQVVHSEPVSLRRLFPQTPRDLETICLKCLSRDPRKRYTSPLALAEDLRRYRNGEAIRARATGPAGRLWRWSRRNPLPASLLVSMVFCLVFGCWYLSWLTDYLVRSAALDSAAQQSDALLEVNDSYSDVVKRATAGGLSVTHNYQDDNKAIPIPATFTIELGEQISKQSKQGEQIRLYSDYPFRSRRNGGPKDDFERDALRLLRAAPKEPVYRFEEYQGRPVLRYATARQMQETCVKCHNSHPDSPKTDWKVDDVRGVVEIIYPLDRDAARTGAGLRGAFVLVGAVCLSLLALTGLALFVGRLKRQRDEGEG